MRQHIRMQLIIYKEQYRRPCVSDRLHREPRLSPDPELRSERHARSPCVDSDSSSSFISSSHPRQLLHHLLTIKGRHDFLSRSCKRLACKRLACKRLASSDCELHPSLSLSLSLFPFLVLRPLLLRLTRSQRNQAEDSQAHAESVAT